MYLCHSVEASRVLLTMTQTKGLALEDVAEIFGDGIVLTDTREEQIHQQFKQSHYHAEVLDEVADTQPVHVGEKGEDDKAKTEHIS